MTDRVRSKPWTTAAVSAGLLFALAGCRATPATVDDAALTASVQTRIAADGAVSSEPIQVTSQAGTVTLTGGVSSIAARSLAARDAAEVAGVTRVMNDLTVAPTMSPENASASAHVSVPRPMPEPTPQKMITPAPPLQQPPETAAAPITRTPPPEATRRQPPAPPPSFARSVALPAGSTLPIRITQSLDSASSQPGDTFSGAVASDIVIDGMVMIPRGAPVTGRVIEVHEAAHFKGSSLLTVELTDLKDRGDHISLATQPYSVKGKGRGENTAVKTGVGAAAGAILGGIFGGGKGAAIGAAVGGGTGAGVNAVTRGQQVQITSETIVRFVTTNTITTRTSVRAEDSRGDPSLQAR